MKRVIKLFVLIFFMIGLAGCEELVLPEVTVKNVEVEVGSDEPIWQNFYSVTYGETTIEEANVDVTLDKGNLNLDKIGNYKLTLTVSSEELNESYEFTVRVVDTIAPTISFVGEENVYAELGEDYVDEGCTYTDNYDTKANIVYVDTVDIDEVGSYFVTCQVTDNAGNPSVLLTRTVQVVDTTAPMFDLIPTQTIESGEFETVDWTWKITNIVEASDGEVFYSEKADNINYDHPGEYIVIVTAMDESFNKYEQSFNVIVVDTTPPVFSLPISANIDALADQVLDFETFILDLSDNSEADVVIEVTNDIDFDTPGEYHAYYKVTDIYGNETEHSFIINIIDETAPTFTLEEGITLEASSNTNYDFNQFVKNVVDNSDTELIYVIDSSNVDFNTPGSYDVSITIKDLYENETSKMFSVTVVDTSLPILNLDTDLYHEAGEIYDWETFIETYITDNSDTSISYNIISGGIDIDTPGTYFVGIEFSDASNNTLDTIVTIEVVDFTSPEFELISTINIEAGEFEDIDWTTYAMSITDNSDTDIFVEEIDNVIYDTKGSYQVLITVTDLYDNESKKVITVTIVDTTGPVFGTVLPLTIEIQSDDIDFTDYVGEVLDNSVGTVILIEKDNVDYTAVGEYIVTVTAVDSSANTTAIDIVVTVVDTTSPVLVLNKELTIESGLYTFINYLLLIESVTDNSALDVTSEVTSTDVIYNVPGVYTVEITATDLYGNYVSDTITVTVEDTVGPTFDLSQTNFQFEANISTEVNWLDYASNLKDKSVGTSTLAVNDEIEYGLPGTYSVEVIGTDSYGNERIKIITVVIVDTTAPSFTLLGDLFVEVNTADYDWTNIMQNVTDNSTRDITVSETDSVDYTKVGEYTVVLTATDPDDNFTSQTITVTVEDTISPTTDTLEFTFEVFDDAIDWLTYLTTADNSLQPVVISIVEDNVDYDVTGDYTVNILLTDESGNEASYDLTVNIIDVIAPTVNLNSNSEVFIEIGTVYVDPGFSVYDNYDVYDDLIINISNNVNFYLEGIYTYTYSVSDVSGNETIKTRTLHITENFSPDDPYKLKYFMNEGLLHQNDIIEDSEGNFVTIGTANDWGVFTKFSASGDLLSTKTIMANSCFMTSFESITEYNGHFYIVGSCGDTTHNGLIMKTDLNGTVIDENHFNLEYRTYFDDIVIENGVIYILGRESINGSNDTVGVLGYNSVVYKLDTALNIEWNSTGISVDTVTLFEVGATNATYIASNVNGSYLMTVNLNTIVSSQQLLSTNTDYVYDTIRLADGKMIAVGYNFTTNIGYIYNLTSNAKYQISFNSKSMRPTTLIQRSDGTILIAGLSVNGLNTWLLTYNSNLSFNTSKLFSGSGTDAIEQIAEMNGDIFMTGHNTSIDDSFYNARIVASGVEDYLYPVFYAVLPANLNNFNGDVEPPVITMNGDSIMNIIVGTQYVDPSISIADNRTTSFVYQKIGTVNTDVTGIYFIYYTTVDQNGNHSFERRIVNVYDFTNPEFVEIDLYSIPDIAYRNALSAYDNNNDGLLTSYEISTVVYLEFNDVTMGNLEILSGFTSLNELVLNEAGLDNLYGLDQLTNLRSLTIKDEKLTNLDGLEGNTYLEELTIDRCYNLNNHLLVNNLTNLTYLYIYDGSDLSHLGNLPSLETIVVGQSAAVSISKLNDYPTLKNITLENSSNLQTLTLNLLPDLETLTINSSNIQTLTFLADNAKLTTLSIDGEDITDISTLLSLINLETVSFTSITYADLPVGVQTDIDTLRSNGVTVYTE